MASQTAEAWVFTSADAGATIWWKTQAKIKHMEFSGYVNQADSVVVQNQNGIEIWKGTGTSDGQEVRSGTIGWINGLQIPTLTNGTLKVYTE